MSEIPKERASLRSATVGKEASIREDTPTLAGVFSGIGGLEHGLALGQRLKLEWMCEIWEPARAVLTSHFQDVTLESDVRQLARLPESDYLCAGFPCTDLSPAGLTAGLGGSKSGLIMTALNLIEKSNSRPNLIIENVPNMLSLQKGYAMRIITEKLEGLGYKWAYRVVDTRFTGLPQRRLRVILLAMQDDCPQDRLFSEDAGAPDEPEYYEGSSFGFYWTEGRGGLGWAIDAIPTLKGGSTIGIASAPAIWNPNRRRGQRIVTPSIADGERLQGFAPGWTTDAQTVGEHDHRWKLIGNAVPVPVADWLGEQLTAKSRHWEPQELTPLIRDGSWPASAWFDGRNSWVANVSAWPRREPYQHLATFIDFEAAIPLSHRATLGFLRRLDHSNLRVDPNFLKSLEDHLRAVRSATPRSTVQKFRPSVQAKANANTTRPRNATVRVVKESPEVRLRKELHRRGMRYRLHSKLDGSNANRISISFRKAKVAVEVKRCRQNLCPDHWDSNGSDSERWIMQAISRQRRDSLVEASLRDAGWKLLVVWEHDDTTLAAKRVERLVRSRSQP